MNATNWTPERRAQLVEVLRDKVVELEADDDLRSIADWMIEACALTPSSETRQLVLLASIVATS